MNCEKVRHGRLGGGDRRYQQGPGVTGWQPREAALGGGGKGCSEAGHGKPDQVP